MNYPCSSCVPIAVPVVFQLVFLACSHCRAALILCVLPYHFRASLYETLANESNSSLTSPPRANSAATDLDTSVSNSASSEHEVDFANQGMEAGVEQARAVDYNYSSLDETSLQGNFDRPSSMSGDSYTSDSSSSTASIFDDDNDPLGIRRGGLATLAREWIVKQLGRVCSDAVSNDYFDFALEYADVFMHLKQTYLRKPPCLRDLRPRVMKKLLPDIKMDFVFDELPGETPVEEAEPVTAYDCDQFPKGKFPPDKYDLVSQVTRVKVSELN